MGVPGVVQKSYSLTRFLRSQHNAYDLKDKSHFIGILYDKNLIKDFQAWSTSVYMPSPAPLSKDIYNQFINNQTPALNAKTLAQLVGQLKGTLVRLGPDLLELKESQNEEQKGRSQDETPTSRDANRKE
ncbi:15375_t:CDS:2, partial [Racocetra persica]